MFTKGFKKISAAIASKGISPHTLEQMGLGALAVPVAAHTYRAIKEKKPGEAAMSGTELAGLGILSRAAAKAHK